MLAGCSPACARMPQAWSSVPGEAGAFVMLRDGTSQAIPGFKVAAVDTNGAGDTHIGAFVSALARGAGAVRGGALRQCRGRHLRHPARRIVRRRPTPRSTTFSPAGTLPARTPIRTARKINGLTQPTERNEHEQTACNADGDHRPRLRLRARRPGRRGARAQLEGLWRRRALGDRSLREGDRPQGRQRLLQFRAGDADQAQDQSRPLRRRHDQRRLQRPGAGGEPDPADRYVEDRQLCRHQPGQGGLADAQSRRQGLRRAMGLGPDRDRHQRQVLRQRRRPAFR